MGSLSIWHWVVTLLLFASPILGIIRGGRIALSFMLSCRPLSPSMALSISSLRKITRRMGRPPLNVKPTVVRLPVEALERIEAVVGKNRMAEFIREAVERELNIDGPSIVRDGICSRS